MTYVNADVMYEYVVLLHPSFLFHTVVVHYWHDLLVLPTCFP